MPRHLQHDIATRFVHPIEQHQVRTGLDVLERRRPTRVDLDGTDGVRLARVLGTILAVPPGRADAPDVIERGVVLRRQVDRDLALPDAEGVLLVRCAVGHAATVAWLGAGAKPSPTPGLRIWV